MSRPRQTPVVQTLSSIFILNGNISSLSSYVNSIVPIAGPTTAQFQALSNEYSTMSTNISSISGVYSTNLSNYNNLSTFYNVLSSGLNLVAKVDYLSSLAILYFRNSTFQSSLTINKSLNVGCNTIAATTIFNAAIGSNNTLNSDVGLMTGQLNNSALTTTGFVGLNYGNNITTGIYSHAEGSSASIQGSFSHSEGGNNINNGNASHVEGNAVRITASNSHGEGLGTSNTASVDGVHIEGFQTIGNGLDSHAEGTFSETVGIASHAEGFGADAVGNYSHAEGWSTYAGGEQSHAQGYSTFISVTSSNSHAEGQFTSIINAHSAHAEGFRTIVTGAYGHAEGWSTYASTIGSHTEGRETEADGDYSHAEGTTSIVFGLGGHIEGSTNRVLLDGSHAEGARNSTIGLFCHVHGLSNLVSSIVAHGHGMRTSTMNEGAHAHGSNTIASGIASHMHGNASIAPANGAIGNYSHVHSCNVGAGGVAATSLGGNNGTNLRHIGNYTFASGFGHVTNSCNIIVAGSTHCNNIGYNYVSYLGGFLNFSRLNGSWSMSSTSTILQPQGIGARVLGGSAAYPRTNWTITNSAGRIDAIFGSCQTELFSLYCTTSTTNTYCNLVYLSNKADEVNPTTSNMPAYEENSRYHMNTFEIQVMGYEKSNASATPGLGIFSANYRFNCYWDNTSTTVSGVRFRDWSLCDSDGNTIGVDTFKELSSIITLNKLTGTPSVSLRAYISTTVIAPPAEVANMQSITALSIRANTAIPINWYTQVKQGVLFCSGVSPGF